MITTFAKGIALTENGELLQARLQREEGAVHRVCADPWNIKARTSYGEANREILYEYTRSSSLGFDQHRSPEGLQCLEEMGQDLLGYSELNLFLFGPRGTHSRATESGTKNPQECWWFLSELYVHCTVQVQKSTYWSGCQPGISVPHKAKTYREYVISPTLNRGLLPKLNSVLPWSKVSSSQSLNQTFGGPNAWLIC